jgi:hypothetical protein
MNSAASSRSWTGFVWLIVVCGVGGHLSAFASSPSNLNEFSLPANVFEAVRPQAEALANRGYMAPAGKCKPVAAKGYEGLPTKRCTYSQGKLSADVILLDPDAVQLTRWVVFTCQGLASTDHAKSSMIACSRKLLTQIRNQSSGHFPVAGVVMENGKAYAFRDGITIQVGSFRNGTARQLTQEQIEDAISGPVIGWGRFARLQATTYENYRMYGRQIDGVTQKLVDDSALTFPELIGQRWRNDLGHNMNSLLQAWACANGKYLGTSMTCVSIPEAAGGSARNKP